MSDDPSPIRQNDLPSSGQPARNGSIMNRIVTFSLDQQFVILLMTLTLIGVGAWALQRLPLDCLS
jgi:hypothetical protein